MAEETPQRTRETVEMEIASKAWQDEEFLEELRTNPKAVIAKEYGVEIPDNVDLKVVEESLTELYIRIPPNPNDLELSDEQLEAVAGGECIITSAVISGVIAGTFAVTAASISVSQQQTERHGW
ncbi:NHLP leader peptide family RiPP precursor [Chloroflexota bacterium]